MSQHVFDYAVIGAGLGGLATAVRLSKETSNVVLLDGADQAGGINRPINFPTGVINNGLRFMPDTELNRQAVLFMEDLLGLKLLRATEEVPPVTYEEGELRQFVGFGDNPPEFYDQMLPMTHSSRLVLTIEPAQWPALLQDKFEGQFNPRSYVTRLNFEDPSFVQLTINGAKTIRAVNVIYAGPVKSLSVLLPPEVLNPRAKQKLSKNLYWTALSLDLCHSTEITQSSAMHILNGTTQDDIGPCAGRFLPSIETADGNIQTSQWVTFVDEEVTEDSEIVAASLKKIKRQLKRAYPQALDELVRERIMVAPMVGGNGDLKLKGDQSFPEARNLWIASAAISPEKGLAGGLLQAQLVLSSLGFGKAVQHSPELAQENSHEIENVIEA